MAGGGASSTAAFVAGGYGNPPSPNTNIADTEIWNGSSWTEVNNLNTGRSTVSGGGTSTLSMVFGGGPTSPTYYAVTEIWNGSSWTEVADLATGRESISSSRTSNITTSGLAAGGNLPPATTSTEEWSVPNAVVTVTTS